LSFSLLSRLSGIDSFYFHGIETGYKKNIRADFESVILSWTPELVAEEKKVRTASARRHLQALEERGMSLPEIALITGVEESKLHEIKTGTYIETRIERALLAVA
jgi:hypothetical protein